MFIRERIMERLTERGYSVEAYDKVNNGVVFYGIVNRGFVDKSRKVCPIVYLNDYMDDIKKGNTTINEIVHHIEHVFQSETPKINLEQLQDPRFILRNVYIGLQKESDEEIIKRECEFEGIEAYLFVDIGEGTFKMTRQHHKTLSIPVEEVWRSAERNTRKKTVVRKMYEVINELIGEEILDDRGDGGLYVVSNQSRYKGAAAVLNKDMLRELAEEIGVDGFIIIPSSIHEMLLMPYEEENEVDMEEFNEMVASVNCTEVAPEERLTDRAYLYKIA